MEFDSKNHRFYIEDNSELIGEIKFTPINDSKIISIDHTFVKETHRNQGLARIMLNQMIKYATDNDLKIIPICPYAKSQFAKDTSIRGVLDTNYLNNLISKENDNGSK
ncbi:N-acetyltransferase [Companilactobacillus sp. RD055328]|uniref:GNAT family N-acetyltransferase n=1 Tax=Companilactobacillus sp. RD055328 TaxID=2916634 RepID=UPI001FC7DF1B|nr:GNAT family N-acetyltransferase [Companilactobacillus sp. RD055328]GKQ42179.1 N-acetyltransferase [Companilactobacillus sp. RD055328]